ncbi:soluble quino protein glucose dehydrogenase [Pluteus cervinus]|uniref:Soluble quino protein glucose dehydrogenase n=1 Tax=Pluteus cervinus TaxID=181527 RepID=A0ACD3A6W8_9AGAR|nr:soluble quino protein glucose dehydrogenase [Pluteus cervinus]
MLSKIVLVGALALQVQTVYSQCQAKGSVLFAHKPTVGKGLSAHVVYNGLKKPRGIKFDDLSNLLVVDVGVGVVALTSKNSTDCMGWERKVVLENGDLNHGIELDGTSLFVSTESEVLEYQYNASSLSVSSGNPRTVVKGMKKPEGGHYTRTLVIQPSPNSTIIPHIIISRGSDGNVEPAAADPATGTAQIRRFALHPSVPDGGYDWFQGQLLASGIRNAVGMTLDKKNKLWSVENSVDEVTWNGKDVHTDNPAEELNVVDLNNISGASYGYPNCYTAWDMSSFSGPSTGGQFTAGSDNASISDAFCSNTTNVVPPALNFEAHVAPLDIKFYGGIKGNETEFGITRDWTNDAFVSFHGSWNREPPAGYGVVRIPWSGDDSVPQAKSDSKTGYEYVVQAPDMNACPSGCIRPVGLEFDQLGRLFVSSDATGEVFVIEDGNSPDASWAISTGRPNISTRYLLSIALVSSWILL